MAFAGVGRGFRAAVDEIAAMTTATATYQQSNNNDPCGLARLPCTRRGGATSNSAREKVHRIPDMSGCNPRTYPSRCVYPIAAARVAPNVVHVTRPHAVTVPRTPSLLPVPSPSHRRRPEARCTGRDSLVSDNISTRYSSPIAGARQDCERGGHTLREHGVTSLIHSLSEH